MNGTYKNIFLKFFLLILYLFSALNFPKDQDTVSINFKTAFNNPIGNEILARIGNKEITVREFLSCYEFGPAFPKRIKDSKKHFLDYMINEKLMAMEGYSERVNDSSQVKEMLEAIKGDLSTEEMFKDDILNKIKVNQSELQKAVEEKQFIYKIRWLYSPDEKSILFLQSQLNKKVSFDSLFKNELSDSVFADQRSMEVDKFKLKMQNPEMYEIIDTLKPGNVSAPIKAGDGWYIFKLDDIWKNMIESETEAAGEKADAEEAIKKEKMDTLSDIYVKNLLESEKPIIKGNAFSIVRSYLGSYELPKEKYNEWGLEEKLQEQLRKFNSKKNDVAGLILVTLKDTSFNINDFINWYRMRSEYIKLDKTDFNKFSGSLESNIWQMVRDNLLMKSAYSRGYQNKSAVKQQLSWWEDKIVYAVMRDKLINSIKLNDEEKTNSLPAPNEKKDDEITKKILHKIIALREKYKVKINQELLNKIYVEQSHDPRTIDIYFVKKGGIFPHPAYPTIDMLWQNWQ